MCFKWFKYSNEYEEHYHYSRRVGVYTSFWVGALWDRLWGRLQAVQKAVDFIPQMDQFSTQVLHLRWLQWPRLPIHYKHTTVTVNTITVRHLLHVLISDNIVNHTSFILSHGYMFCPFGFNFRHITLHTTEIQLQLMNRENVLLCYDFVNKLIKIISITRLSLYDEVVQRFGFDPSMFFPKSICVKPAAA